MTRVGVVRTKNMRIWRFFAKFRMKALYSCRCFAGSYGMKASISIRRKVVGWDGFVRTKRSC